MRIRQARANVSNPVVTLQLTLVEVSIGANYAGRKKEHFMVHRKISFELINITILELSGFVGRRRIGLIVGTNFIVICDCMKFAGYNITVLLQIPV